MLFKDILAALGKEIDPQNVRINAFPDIVWVFGGPTSIKSEEAFCSLRNVFLARVHESKSLLAPLVKIPEDYGEWNTFDGYPDLLEFERDAGYLAKATVIFCESPGAFAEIGAFASDPHLPSRTIVVIERDQRNEQSYINLGPIRRIDHADEKAVCVIDAKEVKDFPTEVDQVIRAIEGKINKAHKTETFQSSSVRDQFLLVADIIDLLQAITVEELLEILPIFSVNLTPERLRQLLRQLSLFELIKINQVLNVKYLSSGPNGRQYIDYQSTPGLPPFDRARYKTNAFAFLKEDEHRFRAFQLSRESRS